MARESMEIPEELTEAIEERFGLGSTGKSETVRRALFFAVAQWDEVYGDEGDDSTD